jgi:hypothetical protein
MGVAITNVKVSLMQDGNTMGTTDSYETLDISLEYQDPQAGKADDCFLVIKTEGWSFDTPEELMKQISCITKYVKLCDEEINDKD